MPAGYLHQRCAELAAKGAGISPEPSAAYILGAQGPDPLFALGIFPLGVHSQPERYGNTVHTRRAGAFLLALLEAAKGGTAAQRAYAMGFLTHNALDSTAHPHVYKNSLKKNGQYSSTLHMALEKRWDARRYSKDGLKGAPVWLPGAEEARPYWPEIAALWEKAAQAVFPEEGITAELVMKALSDSARICRITHSPRGIKYAAFWALERLIGKPQLLTSQMVPRFPKRDADEQSENKLFEKGVEKAQPMLSAAKKYYAGELNTEALAKVVGNRGYDTGTESLP